MQIAKLKQEGRRRLLVDMADIRRFDEKLEKAVRTDPTEYIGAFEEALTDAIKNEDPTYFKVSEQRCGAIGGRSSPWVFHFPLRLRGKSLSAALPLTRNATAPRCHPSLTNAPPSDRRMVRARMWASRASSASTA